MGECLERENQEDAISFVSLTLRSHTASLLPYPLVGVVLSSPRFSGRNIGPPSQGGECNHIVRGAYRIRYTQWCIYLWENTICQRFSDYQERKLFRFKELLS